MNWIKKLKSFLCEKQPRWAYGLECQICKKTFVNAESHKKYAKANKTKGKHVGKIPVLRK